MSTPDTTIPPQISAALDDLKGRVRRRFFVHGLGYVVAAVLALFLVHYLLDRGLELPRVPRLILLAGIAIALYRGIRRRLAYPLARPLTRTDIALLIERNHEDLHQELVSAVQLDPATSRGDSPELIRRVQDAAAERVRSIDGTSVIRNERTVRVWSIAAGVAVLFGIVAGLSPQSFGVWCVRLLGIERDYPRETFLTLEVPADQGNYRVVASPDEDQPIRVQLARGAELPLNVLVEGVVPNLVELVTVAADGSEFALPMSRRGDVRFRTIVRRTLEPFEVYARGGDDTGTRHAIVEILVPPAATELVSIIEPPAYTKRPRIEREGGLIEALPGSAITVRFRATTALSSAVLAFQESDVEVEAKAEPDLEAGSRGAGGSDVETHIHVARFTMPEKADRYRLRLVAENGLSELSPSHYSVVPIPDEKPRIRVFSPGASLQATTTNAKLPLRWAATDDFGLARVTLTVTPGTTEDAALSEITLFDAASTRPPDTTDGGAITVPQAHADLRFLELADFANGDRKPQVGDRITLSLVATDNREPEAQVGRPQEFRLDVLDVEELQRRLQSRLRATRSTVERALRVQEEQRTRSGTFLAAIEGTTLERRRLLISATEAGQQRVRGFLLQIRNEFSDALDSHLFNGLEDSPEAATVLERYENFYRENLELEPSDPAFWIQLFDARKKGQIGRLDLIGRLDDMLMIAHDLMTTGNDTALRALATASTATADEAFTSAMKTVAEQQDAIADGLARLLALLEDWNDYQDVVRITRRLRDAQRDLQDRIKSNR
ncbi:MAG: hypothetical protein KDC95_10755 [Planctomycetes bacterium]|nr:hypothetical protein [Planctomycetota bacterium]